MPDNTNRSVFMPDFGQMTEEGPFSAALQPPANPQPQPTLGAGGGKALGAAYIGTQFLQGMAQSRIRAFQMKENEKIQKLQKLNSFMMYIDKNPDLSPEDKNKAQQMYFKALGTDITASTAKGGKGDKGQQQGIQHHFADIIKQVALGAVGGKLPKGVKNVDPDAVIGQISGILFDPNGKPKQPYNPVAQSITQTEAALGRKLTDQEKNQMAGLPGNPFLDKKKQVEQALGRQLKNDEAEKLLGVYVAPTKPEYSKDLTLGKDVPGGFDASGRPVQEGAKYRLNSTDGKYYGPVSETPKADKLRPPISVDKLPPDVKMDGNNVPIDRRAGNYYRQSETSGKWYPVTPPAGLSPMVTTTLRPVQQQDGSIVWEQVSTTRTPGGPSGTPKNVSPKSASTTAPPPSADSGSPARPPAIAKAGETAGHKPITAAQLKSQQIASGARDAGIALSEMLPELAKDNPEYFGKFVGRTMGIQKFAGVQPDWVADVESQAGSLEAFLTGVHNARGVKYVEHWKEILNNPYVNPTYTARVAKTLSTIADGVYKFQQNTNTQNETMEEAIARMKASPEYKELFAPLDKDPKRSAPANKKPPADQDPSNPSFWATPTAAPANKKPPADQDPSNPSFWATPTAAPPTP